MDLKQVEKQLDDYWDGNSSVEEEMALRDFFSKEELPAHLEVYRKLFTNPDIPLNPELGKDFDKEILNKIASSSVSTSSKLWSVFKVAAIGLLLIITSISVFNIDRQTQLAEDTSSTPEEALDETKKAFLLIAEAMNKGEEPVNHFSRLDKTNNKITNNE